MADFLLYILKINLLAAAVILLTAMVSRNLARKYSVRWKYRIWLALAILLLLPMHVPDSWNVVEIHVPAVFAIKTQQSNLPKVTGMAESAEPDSPTPIHQEKLQDAADLSRLRRVSHQNRCSLCRR